MKKQYITADALKAILKLSIKIGLELGFYISYTGMYIELDQYDNKDKNKVQVYYFEREQLHGIFEHLTAYGRLHKRKTNIW